MEKPLEEMGEEELRAHIQSAEKALEKLQAKRRRENLAEAKRLAAEVGFEVDFRPAGERKAETKREKTPPRYRNPRNPQETWTGRGRPPKWVETLKAEGISLEAMEVSPAAAGSREPAT